MSTKIEKHICPNRSSNKKPQTTTTTTATTTRNYYYFYTILNVGLKINFNNLYILS